VGDYKKAAEYVHQYLTFDQALLDSEGGGDANNPDSGADALLKKAHKPVAAAVHQKFDAAAEAGNGAEAEEYFILFPLVGEAAEGLAKYGRFLAAELAAAADSRFKEKLAGGEVTYVMLLSKLVEGTATVITVKQPLVDSHYGKGQMLRLIKPLQEQCDVSAVVLLQAFVEESGLDRRAAGDASATDDAQTNERTLSSLASVMQRGELYLQFLRTHITAELDYIATQAGKEDAAGLPEAKTFGLVVANGDLAMEVQGLIGSYITLEEEGLKYMVSKAIELNTREGDQSRTTTVVDDAFFVITKSARRAMSTLSANCFCAMLNQICMIIETTYLDLFREPLRVALSGGLSTLFNAASRGVAGSADTSAADLLVTLNNLAISNQYAMKLYNDLQRESKRLYGHAGPTELSKISSCLEGISNSAHQIDDLLKDSIAKFCSGTLGGKLRPLAEALSSFNYVLSDGDGVGDGSQFVEAYVPGLKVTLAPYQRSLVESNFELLLATLSEVLAAQLEKAVLRTEFNQLGGIQLEKDLRLIQSNISSYTQWSCRDKFVRLSQMAVLLCLETVGEVSEYIGPSALSSSVWQLNKDHVKATLKLREDLDEREIDRI
jgi:hypothetical protein